MAATEEQLPSLLELEEFDELDLQEEQELPEDEFPSPEYVGQVTVGNKYCIGGTAYIDVWIEIRPSYTAYVYLGMGFFNSGGTGIGRTPLLGPFRPSSPSQRYIGRRLTMRLPSRCAYVQGFGGLAGSSTLYRSARVPFICGPWRSATD